jgi:hypothetical protein
MTIQSLSAIIASKSSAIPEGLYSSDILPVYEYSAICATGWRRGIGAATSIGMMLQRNGFSNCIEWHLRRAGGDLKELVVDVNSKDERRDALGMLLDGSDKCRWGLIWKLGSGKDNICALL